MLYAALLSLPLALGAPQGDEQISGSLDSKHVEVVIAHFDEDLSWATDLADLYPTMSLSVYTKGPTPVHETVAMLPNIGRQAHTYLHHIVENYHNLAPWTIFVPGGAQRHGGVENTRRQAFSDFMEAFQKGKDSLFPISAAVQLPRGVSTEASEIRGNNECPVGGADGWEEWRFDEGSLYHQFAARMQNFYRRAVLNEPLLKSEAQRPVTLGYDPSISFALSSDRVKSRPLRYYTRLLAEVSDHANPVESNFLNAAWYDVFHPERLQTERPVCQFPSVPPELGVETEDPLIVVADRRLDDDNATSSTTATISTTAASTTDQQATTSEISSPSSSSSSAAQSTVQSSSSQASSSSAAPSSSSAPPSSSSQSAASSSPAPTSTGGATSSATGADTTSQEPASTSGGLKQEEDEESAASVISTTTASAMSTTALAALVIIQLLN